MSQAERDRLCVIRAASDGRITRRRAAEQLGVERRQVRWLVARYRERGDAIAVHGLKGRPGNRAQGREHCIRELVSELRRERYEDYSVALFTETLAEAHGLEIPRETVRRWLATSGARAPRKRRQKRHPRRAPRARRGELVQLDTSTHLWFERRGGSEYGYLICAIDDATSEVYGRFYEGDTSLANMDLMRRWIERNGRPEAFYFDRASHFAGETDEDGGDGRLRTQVGRMLGELGVEPILAYSPQAKGRVERTFGTHQDRLVKKLRERGISTIEAANEYLESEYWAEHNRKFARRAAERPDAHQAPTIEQQRRMDEICAVREVRTLQAGDIVKVSGRWLLVKSEKGRGPRRGAKIEVLKQLSGALRLRHDGHDLAFEDVTAEIGERNRERRQTASRETRRARLLAEVTRRGIETARGPIGLVELQALRPAARPAPGHPWRNGGPTIRTVSVVGPPARDAGGRDRPAPAGPGRPTPEPC